MTTKKSKPKTKSKSKKITTSIKKPITSTKISINKTKSNVKLLETIRSSERLIKKYEKSRRKAHKIVDPKKRKSKLSTINTIVTAARQSIRRSETKLLHNGAVFTSSYFDRNGNTERKVRTKLFNIDPNKNYNDMVYIHFIPKIDVVGTDGQTIEAGTDLWRPAYLDEQTLNEWFSNIGLDENDYVLIETTIKQDLI